MPLVIFVTAYDQHALRAFEVRALDYLLKPFDRERFREALAARACRSRAARPATSAGACSPSSRTSGLAPARTERIVVKSGGKLFFLRTDEIDWIEAAGNYAKVHVGSDSHLLRGR